MARVRDGAYRSAMASRGRECLVEFEHSEELYLATRDDKRKILELRIDDNVVIKSYRIEVSGLRFLLKPHLHRKNKTFERCVESVLPSM